MKLFVRSRTSLQINHLIKCSVFLVLVLPFSSSVEESSDVLNVCIDGKFHKEKPSTEVNLHNQCAPWKGRSCCTYNLTLNAHHSNPYGFNYDHCSERKNMSSECRRHFLQDLCFYECSPNVGPWVVKIEMKTRKERFFQVPLCKVDCDSWFEACQNDFTCADNWINQFTWISRKNQCLKGSKCRTIKEVFSTASNFCEKVWDHSWKVVPNEEPCMRIWFNGSAGNPNDAVAAHFAGHSSLPLNNSTAFKLSVILFVLSFVSFRI